MRLESLLGVRDNPEWKPRKGSDGYHTAAKMPPNTRSTPVLVLSRKKNERIKIGKEITLVLVEIRGDKVRIGIEAPPNIEVHRQEVYDAIERKAKGGPDAKAS